MLLKSRERLAMSEPPGEPPNEPLPSPSDALPVLGGVLDAQVIYQRAIEQIISEPRQGIFKKDQIRLSKILLSMPTMLILLVIWKESDFVTEEDLSKVGMKKSFSLGNPLNCHGMARQLAVDAYDLAKVQKRIRGIVEAGQAYGLIEREVARSKLVEISGTVSLDALMRAMSIDLRVAFISAIGNGF